MDIINEDELNNFYSAYNKGDWNLAKKYLREAYSNYKKDFWYYTTISSIHYELKKYKKALKFIKKAYLINCNSPLVMWDYAGVLYMLNKEKKAIKLWKTIIALGPDKIGNELTQEGNEWASRIINDSYFRISQAYFYLEKDKKAIVSINHYIKERKKRKTKSLYELIEVEKFKTKILNS